MSTPYSAEFFLPHVGSTFLFCNEDGRQFGLTLDQVVSQDARRDAPFQSFSLFLSSGLDAFFEQGSYPLRHPGLGQHTIFLTAIGESDTGFRYQAAFSVPREPA